MTPITLGDTTIPYRVRVSTRAKRMRLVVKPVDGVVQVELVAPQDAPPDRIAAFAEQKRRWIFKAVREVEARQARQLTQRYADGSTLQFHGRWLTLNVRATSVAAVQIAVGDAFDVQVPQALVGDARTAAIARAFERWLKGRALRAVDDLGPRYAQALGVQPAGYRLTNARRLWGSCAANGVIRVHWRLIQAPVAALEYVVAHEITHLIHRHHQPPFWQTLAAIMPDWADRRAALTVWERAPRAV